MKAAKKMREFGLKALAHAVGHDLVTVYRWKDAIENGAGVRDSVKRKIIAATEKSADPIVWGDFNER